MKRFLVRVDYAFNQLCFHETEFHGAALTGNSSDLIFYISCQNATVWIILYHSRITCESSFIFQNWKPLTNYFHEDKPMNSRYIVPRISLLVIRVPHNISKQLRHSWDKVVSWNQEKHYGFRLFAGVNIHKWGTNKMSFHY